MVRRRCLRTILTGHTCSVVAPKLSYSVAPNWIAFCCPFSCELQAFTCPLKDAKRAQSGRNFAFGLLGGFNKQNYLDETYYTFCFISQHVRHRFLSFNLMGNKLITRSLIYNVSLLQYL